MTIYSILKKCQRIWSVWNIRIVVVSSLWLQIMLIILSPLRRRSRSVWLSAIIWLCYLMADWIAIYSIGVIANNSRLSCDDGNCVEPDLAAFWAPFLLLHLGGPDTITAFSVEDNALWMRHFLSMIVEVAVVLYVLFLAIPSNALRLPFLLVFVASTIKYAERTRALNLACYGNINESWSESDSMEEYVERVKDDMDVLLQAAYRLYKISRKLIYRQLFTTDEFREGQKMMKRLVPEKAFNVVAVDLSFIYDELFTKMVAVHRGGWFSYLSRLICSALIVSAFVIFSTTKKLKVPHNVDIGVTYALLIGAISLDFITWIMLVLSDRTIAFLKDDPKASKVVHSINRKMHSYKSGWCKSISQHNFISYWMSSNRRRTCIKKWFEATISYFGLKATFEELRYKYEMNVSLELKEFIYNYLKELDPVERDGIISSRGKRALRIYRESQYYRDISAFMEESSYESNLLDWHIATDLLYFTQDHNHGGDNPDINYRKICKVLSDQMFYLYIMRPSLISVRQVAFVQSRIDFYCAEMRSVLENQELSEQRHVCEKLLSEKEGHKSKIIRMFGSFSLLTDILKRIAEDDEDKMWRVMSQVWMEMLIHGAYHSEGKAHAQQLGKGGEFITHVWLLMAHFGFTDCYGAQTFYLEPEYRVP